MKLTSALSADFDSTIRSRGASYYRSGAVLLRAGSLRKVEARVRGSRIYDVEITWDGRELILFCDCPFFEGGQPCKHLWATILASDAKDFFGPITRFNSRQVVYDTPQRQAERAVEPRTIASLPVLPPRPYVVPPPVTRPPAPPPPLAPPPKPAWMRRIEDILPRHELPGDRWPPQKELLYQIDPMQSARRESVILNVVTREPRRAGGWKSPEPLKIDRSDIEKLPNADDRRIMTMLTGSSGHHAWSASGYETTPEAFRLMDGFAATVMPQIAMTGRCVLAAEGLPLVWDEGEPWEFHIRLSRQEGARCVIRGVLRRGEDEMDVTAPALITRNLLFTPIRVARMQEGTSLEWINALRRAGAIEAPESDIQELFGKLMTHPLGVRVEAPEDLSLEEVRVKPRILLAIRTSQRHAWEREQTNAELAFDYDGTRVPMESTGRGTFDAATRRYIVRDVAAEEAAKTHLRSLGLTEVVPGEPALRVSQKYVAELLRAGLEAGWEVESDGRSMQKPGAVRVSVASGVDWFELHGEVDYGDFTAKLPELLAALRRGDSMVKLADGKYGLLPEDWLKRFGSFAGLGSVSGDHLRFRRAQTGLLDALLAAQPEVNCDETFTRVRDELVTFAGIGALDQPAGFVGQLRDYQREGLGWMEFLRRFGFGGCLADDMGVGKTAQVLAMLEGRRGAAGGPSLVVVPKSLVFNWKQEAARFTPQLRVLEHTGLARDVAGFSNYDLILTTYGTLRRDAAEFRDLEFDYVVLDEAQAIKNANTESAKAARLLRGRHRLALSGTPVENHLGELWSLFEFLNPGMLGAASVLKLAGGAGRSPSEETRQLLAHALRPFILRRTKEQVARELPPKMEQTIYCELEGQQRKLYNELRDHYRRSLLGSVSAKGLGKSKMLVLEALLRLRQAACHPGLLDPSRLEEGSAKLDVLVDRLSEIVQEGHKALVFSQFTSLLAIVRERIEEQKIDYEYLDGKTRDRQAHVERFQTDPECGVFLISLKAGGLGLNLTAAEYVFLLDPWWNPAVEAQAVDRAHRIGQTQQVFSYRLIAKDTVEEKVVQLQNSKRELAAAIISEDNSLIRNLQKEDLEMLLS